MKWLYCYKKQNQINDKLSSDIECKVFVPKIFGGGYTIPGESRSIKKIFSRLMFQFLTHGRTQIYFVADGEEIMHTSCVIPKCSKFQFLGKDDYEIGPCFTSPKHRGKGIYPAVLRNICQNIGTENTVFYMIVDENNQPSIKGVEKAGFVRCGTVRVTKYTKKYILE